MNVKDIKREALRLMYDSSAAMAEELQYGTDARLLELLDSMTGAINRALSDLERRLALIPVRRVTLPEEWKHSAHTSWFDLESVADLYMPLCVSVETEAGYTGDMDYALEGRILLLPRLTDGASVTLTYAPRAVRIAPYEHSASLVGVPASLAELLPYFIKGELYRDEDPSEAGEARNLYEAGVEDYLARMRVGGSFGNGRVCTVYSQVTA